MKRLKHYNKIILFILVTLLSATGCENRDVQSHTAQIFALDTVIDIKAYGDNAQNAVSAAREEIYRLEDLFSVTKETSEIFKLNHSEGQEVAVSDETYSLLVKAKSLSENTNGSFDVTIYPVLKLWGFTEEEYTVPSQQDISSALECVGYENIILSDNNTVMLTNGAQLDLGGIAKGYIADKAADAMTAAGCESGLLSLGGNVRTVGSKASGEKWKIGIQYPDSSDYFGTVEAEACSVITSGAYQRNFTADGVTYHHIIDPETGKPSCSDALSVTVIGEDGALCDALSTAIFVGGTKYAKGLRNTDDRFEYVILSEDGNVYISEGLKDTFTLSEEYNDLITVYQ